MATTPEIHQPTTKTTNSPKMVALGSFIGTTIEWYDFFLYGTAAALVFSPLFFPNVSPAVGLIAAFGTYAVGFIARPIGGLVAGHFGDRIGRKVVLVASLLIMGAATALIGALPTYASIGIWAPILLMVLRIAQGFGVGGEWGGAALLSVESAPSHRRGFYGSFTQIGVSAGMLLATGMFAIGRYTLSEEAFLAWGWRIPFLLSAILVMVGLLIRLKLAESESFETNKANNAISEKPLVEVLQKERRSVFLTIGMRLSQNAIYYLYTVFALAYIAKSFGAESNVGLNSVLIASAIGLISVPIWAHISDRVGRKKVYLFGAITTSIFIVPFFMLADTGNAFALTLAMVIGLNFFHDAMYGPQAAFFSEMFSTGVRYSGASMGYQIGSVLSGGFAPLIATSLLALGNGKPWFVIAYFSVLSIITIICAALAPETNKKDISGTTAETTYVSKNQLPADTAL